MSAISVLKTIGNVLRTAGAVSAEFLDMPIVGQIILGKLGARGTAALGQGMDVLGSVASILGITESIFPTVNGVKGGPAKLQAAAPIVGQILQVWAQSNLPGHSDVIVTPAELNAKVQAWTSATADLMNCFGKKS